MRYGKEKHNEEIPALDVGENYRSASQRKLSSPLRCIMRFSVVVELSRMSFQTVEAVVVNFLNGPSIDHRRNL